MPIYKKINNKDVKVADNKILDHSELSGREAYGAHPISAIRNLPEKLSMLKGITQEIQSKADQITIQGNSDGTITLTKYDGTTVTIQSGYLPDNTTIVLDDPDQTFDKLTAIALKTTDGVISGQAISNEFVNLKSVVNAKGGYLDSYDFQTATPSQEDLTDYALQDIGISSASAIWDKTRVINLYTDDYHPDQDTWIWDSHSRTWSNLGNISFVSDANNDGLHGLVTGAPDDGEHDFMGNITALGQIRINGLAEFVAAITQDIEDLTDLTYTSTTVNTWQPDNSYQDYPYKGVIPIQDADATMIPSIVFTAQQAASGNYLTVAESFNGGVYIWSKVNTTIEIPLITLQRTVV